MEEEFPLTPPRMWRRTYERLRKVPTAHGASAQVVIGVATAPVELEGSGLSRAATYRTPSGTLSLQYVRRFRVQAAGGDDLTALRTKIRLARDTSN